MCRNFADESSPLMPNHFEYKKTIPSVKYAIFFAMTMLLIACSPDAKTANDISKLKTFTLSDAPTFTLTDDGTPEHTFARISARHLANGNIAIHDEPANRIVVFDRSGKLVRELTHRGSGPGEMDQTFRMTSIGDTILVLPLPMVMPVSIFVADQGFVEKYSPKAHNYEHMMTAVARLSAHYWLVKQGENFRALTRVPAVGEIGSDSLTYGIVSIGNSPESTVVHWLPSFVNSWNIGAPMTPPAPAPALPTTFPMKGAVMWTVSGARLWLVNGENGSVVAYDTTGTAVIHDSLNFPRKPFNQSEVAEAKAIELETARVQFVKDMIEGRYNPKFLPAKMPMFSAAFAGANGEIWLQLYEISPTKDASFVIVGPNGKSVATATLPSGLRVQQLGQDFVIATKTDSSGLQSVVEYALKRN